MKVKCLKIYNEHTKKYEQGEDGWLTIGKEYVVLEIATYLDGETTYRFVSDSGTPAIFKAFQFEVVSEVVPSSWRVHVQQEYNAIDISPAIWRENDFWGAYFDGEAWALEVYEKELAIIYSEENDV